MAFYTQPASYRLRSQPGSFSESLQHTFFACFFPAQLDLSVAMLLLTGMILKKACGVAEHSEKFLIGAIFLVAHSFFMSTAQPRSAASRAVPRGAQAGAAAPRPRRPAPTAGRQGRPGPDAAGRLEFRVTCGVDLQAEDQTASHLSLLEAPVTSRSSKVDKPAVTQSRAPTPATDADLQADCQAAGHLSLLEAPVISDSSEADKAADTQSRSPTSATEAEDQAASHLEAPFVSKSSKASKPAVTQSRTPTPAIDVDLQSDYQAAGHLSLLEAPVFSKRSKADMAIDTQPRTPLSLTDVDLLADYQAASRQRHLQAPVISKSAKADKAVDTQSRTPTSATTTRTKPVYNRCRGLRGECLRLYVEVLESGAAVDLGFFKAVAGSLDQAALRESAVDLLRAMHEQRLVPDLGIQMQLTSPFKGRLPDDLVEVFWDLRQQGCGLCWRARQSLMIVYERSAPERTLELYADIKWLGIQLDLPSCNAVLCALAQGGRADEALELFQQMSNDRTTSKIAVTPNGKSYGSVIRACTAGGKDQMAVALFDYMVMKGTNANRFAYHDAILSCTRLKRMSRALNLYANMKKDRVPPCDHTLRLLIRTCSFSGLHGEAATITEDFRKMKTTEALAESEATTDFRDSSADGESE